MTRRSTLLSLTLMILRNVSLLVLNSLALTLGMLLMQTLKLVIPLKVKLLFLQTTVHSLRSSQVLRVLSTYLRCHGLHTLEAHRTFLKLVTRLRQASLPLTERRERCLLVSNSLKQILGLTSARNTLLVQNIQQLLETSPTLAYS